MFDWIAAATEWWRGPAWTFWVTASLAYLFTCTIIERPLRVAVWIVGLLLSMPFVPGVWIVNMLIGALYGEAEDE